MAYFILYNKYLSKSFGFISLPKLPDNHLPPLLNLRINKVRPGLKHLPALIQVLRTVVNAANSANLMRQAFLYPVGVVALLM